MIPWLVVGWLYIMGCVLMRIEGVKPWAVYFWPLAPIWIGVLVLWGR